MLTLLSNLLLYNIYINKIIYYFVFVCLFAFKISLFALCFCKACCKLTLMFNTLYIKCKINF